MKVAITSQGKVLQAAVDSRFGRANYFLIVDTERDSVTAIENRVSQTALQGAGIQAGKKVVDLGVGAIITGHVGPKAFATLEAGNVAIYTCGDGTAAQAIEQFKAGSLKMAAAADVEGHW